MKKHKAYRKNSKGLNLIEILITISIFSILALLVAQLTNTFVELYTRSRDQADLLRLQRLAVKEIAEGDGLYFDGLKSAPEIIEASDKELSFVPMYRDSSQPAGYYLTNGLLNSVNQGVPAPTNGEYPGGMRIQYNNLTQKYELRYYLSKLPRPGSSTPEVYLRYDNNLAEPLLSELKAKLNIFNEAQWTQYIERYHLIPVKFKWEPPQDNDRSVPSAYVVFTGGNFPLEFDGEEFLQPTIFNIGGTMRNNQGQLFPDPVNRASDSIIIYYHPETEFAVIKNQQHLIARLFIKGSYPDVENRFEFSTQARSFFNREGVNGVFDRSLCLYYDNKLTILPTKKELLTRNLESMRPQFLLSQDLTPESNLEPSQFSYFNSQNTTSSIPMTLINGRLQIPPENFHDISLVRLDFLNIIGLNFDRFSLSEIMKRNYSELIPLQKLSYTHNFHTKSTIFDNSNQGFNQSNCFQTQPAETKCKMVSKNFPSGKLIRLSETMYISNIMIDSALNPSIDGWISIFLRNPSNQRVYQVKIDFDEKLIKVMLKNGYDREDLPYNEENPQSNVTQFTLDNSQFISFTNLQSSGFLDEDFNYSNSNVYETHLDNPEKMELYIEMKETSNIEGFSFTWRPK